MAALFVAGKVEECYRRARDIVNVFYWLHGRHRNGRGPARLPYICDEYYNWRDRLTTTEMFLLRDLGFRVQPEAKLAVLMLISYLQAFEGLARADPDLGQCALNLLNDAFKTVAPLIFKPEELACGAIYLAARTRGSWTSSRMTMWPAGIEYSGWLPGRDWRPPAMPCWMCGRSGWTLGSPWYRRSWRSLPGSLPPRATSGSACHVISGQGVPISGPVVLPIDLRIPLYIQQL